MAENVTLKGDNGELRELLNEYRQTHARSPHTAHFDQSAGGFSAYSDAEDGPGGGNNISRSSTAFFSDELAASTASRPHADRTQSADGPSRYAHGRQDSWAPSVRSSFAAHRHGRTDSWTPSLAPSFASSSSYGGGGGGGGGPGSAGMLSPTAGLEEESDGAGLGFGGSGFPPGGKKGVYSLSGSARRFKDRSASASSSAGPTAWQRGHVKRSFSLDRPRGVQRAFSVRPSAGRAPQAPSSLTPTLRPVLQGVGSIAERSATDDEDTASGMETADVDAFSPSSLDADRNLAAYETGRRSSAPPGPDGPHASSSHDPQVPLSLDDLNVPQISPEKKKIRRRPMLLLSKTKGVQTDPVDFGTSTDGLGFSPPPTHLHHHHQARPSISPSISTTSDLDPRHSASLVSSSPSLPSYNSAAGASSDAGGGGGPHDPRSMALTSLIEYMTRLLAKVSQSDVQTLTKRLKRQHLPGDVGHLAKSTLASIVAEVDDLRDHFRAVLEAERKQDWSALHSAVEKEKLGSLVTRKVRGHPDFLHLVPRTDWPRPLGPPPLPAGLPLARQAVQGDLCRAVFAPAHRQRDRARPVERRQAARARARGRGGRGDAAAAQANAQLVRPRLDLGAHLQVLYHAAGRDVRGRLVDDRLRQAVARRGEQQHRRRVRPGPPASLASGAQTRCRDGIHHDDGQRRVCVRRRCPARDGDDVHGRDGHRCGAAKLAELTAAVVARARPAARPDRPRAEPLTTIRRQQSEPARYLCWSVVWSVACAQLVAARRRERRAGRATASRRELVRPALDTRAAGGQHRVARQEAHVVRGRRCSRPVDDQHDRRQHLRAQAAPDGVGRVDPVALPGTGSRRRADLDDGSARARRTARTQAAGSADRLGRVHVRQPVVTPACVCGRHDRRPPRR